MAFTNCESAQRIILMFIDTFFSSDIRFNLLSWIDSPTKSIIHSSTTHLRHTVSRLWVWTTSPVQTPSHNPIPS